MKYKLIEGFRGTNPYSGKQEYMRYIGDMDDGKGGSFPLFNTESGDTLSLETILKVKRRSE